MLNALAQLATVRQAVATDRTRLAMENAVLRQQLNGIAEPVLGGLHHRYRRAA